MNDLHFRIKLIKKVESYPCLYDDKHEDHSKKAVEAVWAHIGEMCGEKASECKCKWRSMRSSYIRTMSATNATRSTKPYYLAHHLTFLKPYIKFKKGKTDSGNLFDPNQEDEKLNDSVQTVDIKKNIDRKQIVESKQKGVSKDIVDDNQSVDLNQIDDSNQTDDYNQKGDCNQTVDCNKKVECNQKIDCNQTTDCNKTVDCSQIVDCKPRVDDKQHLDGSPDIVDNQYVYELPLQLSPEELNIKDEPQDVVNDEELEDTVDDETPKDIIDDETPEDMIDDEEPEDVVRGEKNKDCLPNYEGPSSSTVEVETKTLLQIDSSTTQAFSTKKIKLDPDAVKRDHCEHYALSIVPYLETMTELQLLQFQRGVIDLIEKIKYHGQKDAEKSTPAKIPRL